MIVRHDSAAELYSAGTPGVGQIVMWVGEGLMAGAPSFITNLGAVAGQTVTWGGGVATYSTTLSGTVSDGTRTACIYLDISTTLVAGAGIVGARIPIIRV